MKSFEQFKNETTEEEKLQFREYMEKQTLEGKPFAETAAEYIRSKGYDVSAADFQPLDDDELENVSGGGYPHSHKWKSLNREKVDSLYFFWKARYRYCQCEICGAREWVMVKEDN